MSNITDWIKYDLYPTLFESIDRALPEHEFKKYSGGWRSKTYLTGSPHKDRIDKTVITKKAPGYILEQGGDVLSLVDYIIKRDNKEFIEAVKTLAEVVGLELPKGELSSEDYQKYKEQATIFEDCNSYFIDCLEYPKKFNDSWPKDEYCVPWLDFLIIRDKVNDYLSSRGYSDEDVKAMEIGYMPGQDLLFKYLISKGHNESSINEVVNLSKHIGDTHILSIPYRSGGSIKGFKFRALVDKPTRDLPLKKFIGGYKVMPENLPKYVNSIGLDKIGGFFNLLGIKGDKDIVIVEGELDSLHATIKGVDNVVAIGGSSINLTQVKDAIKRGAKSFTICLDTEPGKEEETINKITSAIDVILGEDISRVYIATLPDLGDSKTDPDRLIKDKGVEAFKEVIAVALPYYKYKLQNILSKYSKIEEFTERDLDNFLDEVVVTGALIKNVVDRERYKKLFTDMPQVKDLGVTEESLSIVLDKIIISKDKEIQATDFKKLILEASKLQESGEIDKALELLNKKVKDVKITGAKGLLPTPMNFNSLLDEIATLPPAYKTGYSSLDKFIGFTPGAITLIAGRPSHGKTTFMFNLLLEMSRIYKNESFYFFTYEEPIKNISVKLLNRLVATDLSGYYRDINNLSKPTNYEFLKSYIKDRRTDIQTIEEGKRQLQELIDSQRIKVIDRNYSVEELSSLIAYLNKREPIGALFIDYIQRMKTDAKTQDMRTKIAHISDSVLQIAKDSGLPIILGAQLNRSTQDSKGGKPKLENLKEAGNLEEDANTVLSVYNESREKDETSEGEAYKGLREVELEIKALKNREGEVNQTAILTFDKWTGVIKNSSSSKNSFFN